MGYTTVASPDDFEKGMRVWCSALELDGESREQDDLYSRSRSVPERSRDTVFVSDGRGL